MTHTTFLLLLAALLAADVSAPIVGYSVQAARREVRVILGVPGSTHFSEPLAWPAEAASVRVTPGHRWLLALRGEDASASVWIPESGVERSLAKVSGEPGLIAISPSGAAVAFYWREARRLVVYAGLPDAPVLAADFRTGDWASLAISNSGRLAAGQSESGELRLILRDAEPMEKLVREARAVASYGFVGDDNTLAIVEPGSDRVELIGGVRDGSFTRRLLQLPAASTLSAGCIISVWNAPATASRMVRAPPASASCSSAAHAALSPDTTVLPGQSRLATCKVLAPRAAAHHAST